MARKRRKRERTKVPDIPVGSFSDVAFLLIIFFLIATTLEKLTGVVADIPAGQKSEEQSKKTPTVQIHGAELMFNEKPIESAKLRAELDTLKLAERETEESKFVILEATGNVKYQEYFAAMSAITAAGGIIAIVKEDKSKK